MSESDRIDAQQDTRLPLIDTVETIVLIVVPGLLFSLGVVILVRPDEFVAGAMVGGLFGALLAGLRGSLYAVRTDEGIERKLRRGPDESVWTRLSEIEYDEKYDRVLTGVCLLVGVGAFAAIPLLDVGEQPAIRLLIVSFGGFVCALLALGTSQR